MNGCPRIMRMHANQNRAAVRCAVLLSPHRSGALGQTRPTYRLLAVLGGMGAGGGALPGPRGASEGSRWEASTAGRGAPTGQAHGQDRAPAGRMNAPLAWQCFMRPAGAPVTRGQSRWVRSADGASHRLPSGAPSARKLRSRNSTEASGEPTYWQSCSPPMRVQSRDSRANSSFT